VCAKTIIVVGALRLVVLRPSLSVAVMTSSSRKPTSLALIG
jgi:hypothetical protein